MKVVIIIVILFYVFVYPSLVSYVAEKQGRNGLRWFFLSLLINPFFAILALIAIGDTDKKRIERAIADEKARNSVKNESGNKMPQNDNGVLQRLLEQSRKVEQ